MNFICHFTDHHVNAEDAMRLGLIVNELVTNSIKHAFAHVNEPQINIATKLDNTGKLTLEYKDNGPGHKYVSNLSSDEANTHLGTKLIALLREQMKDRYTLVC
ncbi:MAG: sensor histidine kinase [Saprospiraceae bacterium]|nr:sensor histidine kinase [Saprospiraceae bacterium]